MYAFAPEYVDSVPEEFAPARDSIIAIRNRAGGCMTDTANQFPLHALPPWKRPLDIGLVLLGFPILVPLALLLVGYIKIVSPGPVFFRQERIGYQGRPFWLLKFRSMYVNADPKLHEQYLDQLMSAGKPLQKLDGQDPRIIPLGTWFRASGLDELAQLWNVLRGDMSLVGPRPCMPFEYKNYNAQDGLRFMTLPGLTGLWQISGKTQTSFQEMIQLDLDYVRLQSLCLDLRILFRTVPAVLKLLWETKGNSARAMAGHVRRIKQNNKNNQ